MDYLIDPGGERRNEDHNDGQHAGSHAGFFEQAVHGVFSIFHTDDYNEGFDNGVDHQRDLASLAERRSELAQKLNALLTEIEDREQEDQDRAETLSAVEQSLLGRERNVAWMVEKCPNAAVTSELKKHVQDFRSWYLRLASGETITRGFVAELDSLCDSIRDSQDRCEKELAKQSRRKREAPGKAAAIAKANADAENGEHFYEDDEGIHHVSTRRDSGSSVSIVTSTYKDLAAFEYAQELIRYCKQRSEDSE